MTPERWDEYVEDTARKLNKKEKVDTLVCDLCIRILVIDMILARSSV